MHGRLNAVTVKHDDQKLLWCGGVHVDQLRAHCAGLEFIDQHETRARAVVLVLDRPVLQGRPLLSDLEELYRPVAEMKGQEFMLVTGEPAEITGSRDLLAQAIGNLLDNAIKYTPEGGTILLQVQRLEDAIEVKVCDSGTGIPESERQHVLERFVRLENSRHTPGNGLGLSLVNAVAGLHGAELKLDDNLPGLIVILRLPRNTK